MCFGGAGDREIVTGDAIRTYSIEQVDSGSTKLYSGACVSVVRFVPNNCEALGLILNIGKKKNKTVEGIEYVWL